MPQLVVVVQSSDLSLALQTCPVVHMLVVRILEPIQE